MGITRRHGLAAAMAAGGALLGGEALGRPSRKFELEDVIEVRAAPGATVGTLSFAGRTYPCALGRTGVAERKREGDGHTPAGLFPLREVRFRPDRMSAPKSRLPVFPATPSDGWCDDPADLAYNHIVRRPYQTDAEQMWRDDHLYDVLAVIGYNDDPVRPGAGSAIFLHVMRPATDDHRYTAGCVALELEHLLAVLAACTPATRIDIRTI